MIERTVYLEELKRWKNQDLIKVVTGIRRCGKSTLFELFINYLKEIGIKDEQIIKINLEDADYDFEGYKELYDYINHRIDSKTNYYVFLDEVQNVKDFQKAVDSLYIKKNVDVYITGSNAYLLSGELATLLSGRYIEIKMLPLSFTEYKSAYSDITDNDELYQKYISIGSFPYTLYLENIDDVSLYLGTLFNDLIIKDVMIRKNINDESMLKSVAIFALDNIGNLLSTNNIANTMISNGRPINVRTVEKYIEGLCESFFLYKVSRYDIKGKKYLQTVDKYYVSDLGLRYFILGRKIGDRGHILENVVYLELIRRGYDVFVGKIDDLEVDFVAVNNDGKTYIQVCETLRDNDNKILQRELNSLRKINDNYKKIILTYDKMPISNEEGIIVQNVLEWLLDKEC